MLSRFFFVNWPEEVIFVSSNFAWQSSNVIRGVIIWSNLEIVFVAIFERSLRIHAK